MMRAKTKRVVSFNLESVISRIQRCDPDIEKVSDDLARQLPADDLETVLDVINTLKDRIDNDPDPIEFPHEILGWAHGILNYEWGNTPITTAAHVVIAAIDKSEIFPEIEEDLDCDFLELVQQNPMQPPPKHPASYLTLVVTKE